MQAIWFYLTYPFIYLFASLPFGLLYVVSDFFFWGLLLSGYRKKVIENNLRNSFPEKNEKEIRTLMLAYYRYLADLILETVKLFRMTEKEVLEHCHFHNTDWLDKFYEEKKSIIALLGHYGNWEWAGPSYTLSSSYLLVVMYHPLSNPYFEKMFLKMRSRFGTQIIPMSQTLRDMVANKDKVTTTAFIADQTATPENAYWTTFLNQDTAVFNGAEKLAKKFNYPVVYMNVRRMKRGYYEIFPELLFENPKDTKENEISEAFIKNLEREILKDPSIWLWSHRRWKHNRE